MNKTIIVIAALLVASPAFAAGMKGALKYAPGHQTSAKASAPGHQKNTAAAPGHSESAPGQKMKSTTTTGSAAGKKY